MADLFTFLLITYILLNKQNILIKLLSCEFGAESPVFRIEEYVIFSHYNFLYFLHGTR